MEGVDLINDFNEKFACLIENQSLFCPYNYDTFRMI